MAAEDPYKTWLDDFRKEVDSLVDRAPSPVEEAGRNAQAAFSSWWKSEQESLLSAQPAPGLALPPGKEAPSAPVRAPAAMREEDSSHIGAYPAGEMADRLERLAREKAKAEAELSRVAQENALLRQRQGAFRGVTAELEVKISRARESYESSISRLETQVRLFEEQLRSLRQDQAFTEKTCERLESRNESLEAEARLTKEKAIATDRDLLEARRKLLATEEELQKLRLKDAAAEATVIELRRQTSVYQERLVQSQEHTGSDVGVLRQELREFLIKIKRLLDEAQGRQP